MKKSTGAATKAAAEPTIIRLTKIKQWYVVADPETYTVLHRLGAPMIRVHQNFLPTVAMLTDRANVKIKSVDFNEEIMEPFLTKITDTWGRKYGKVQMTPRVIVFSAQTSTKERESGAERLAAAREAVPKVEAMMVAFLARWGYSCQVQYSENKDSTKIKLHVEYWFDSNRVPILPLETPVEELKQVHLQLGLVRLSLSFDDMQKKSRSIGYLHVRIEVSQGGKWNPIHTSKCLPTQVSSVLPLWNALREVVNLDPHNFDNEAS